jgi:hypothetical protein
MSPERYNGKIPFIVTDIVERLIGLHADQIEGIFRRNGPEHEILSLIDQLSRGRVENWPANIDVHTLAGTLKRYLRKIGERDGLIPSELYDRFLTAMMAKTAAQAQELLKNLIDAELPTARQKLLCFLCRYWHQVLEHSDTNKMTATNLGVCVSQVILVIPKVSDPTEAQRQIALANLAAATLIEGYSRIFADVTITSDDFCTTEDLETLKAPKLNMAAVNHLIVRDTLRRESLIPWLPACRAELKHNYIRPARKPQEQHVLEMGRRPLLTPAKMTAVMQSMITMARMSKSPMDLPDRAQLFKPEDLMSPENIVCTSPLEEEERPSPQ